MELLAMQVAKPLATKSGLWFPNRALGTLAWHSHTCPKLTLTLCTLSSLSDKKMNCFSDHNCKSKSGTSQCPAPMNVFNQCPHECV